MFIFHFLPFFLLNKLPGSKRESEGVEAVGVCTGGGGGGVL